MSADGMNYAPVALVGEPVCTKGDFRFSATALDHGHIYGMVSNLVANGGQLVSVYDRDTAKAEELAKQYGATVARSEDEIIEDPSIQLVAAAAAIPNLRGPLGCRVLKKRKTLFL